MVCISVIILPTIVASRASLWPSCVRPLGRCPVTASSRRSLRYPSTSGGTIALRPSVEVVACCLFVAYHPQASFCCVPVGQSHLQEALEHRYIHRYNFHNHPELRSLGSAVEDPLEDNLSEGVRDPHSLAVFHIRPDCVGHRNLYVHSLAPSVSGSYPYLTFDQPSVAHKACLAFVHALVARACVRNARLEDS